MKKIFVLSLIAVTASSVVFAQETKPLGVSVKFGQFKPQAREGKAEGKQWVIFGAETKIKDLKWSEGSGSYLTASVDYFGKGDLTSVPVMMNFINRTNEWYFTAGAGVAFTKDYRIVGSQRQSDDSIEIGYQVGIGYDFQWAKSPLFGELRYMGNANDRLNGFALTVGVRL